MLIWHQTIKGLVVTGMGNQALLTLPMTAFFASRQCPSTAIRAAMDWALQQARAKTVVVSGFHSPLEQSVLKVLMEARSPVVAMLARPVAGAKLPPNWPTRHRRGPREPWRYAGRRVWAMAGAGATSPQASKNLKRHPKVPFWRDQKTLSQISL